MNNLFVKTFEKEGKQMMRGEPTSVQKSEDRTRSVCKFTCWFAQNTGQNQYTFIQGPMNSLDIR